MASYRFWINNLIEPIVVELLLDSSFLMFITTVPIQQLEIIEKSLGKIKFVVLDVIVEEIRNLCVISSPKRAKSARRALDFASQLTRVSYDKGMNVDDKILNYAISKGIAVATLDSGLRKRLKAVGIIVVFRRGNMLLIEKP